MPRKAVDLACNELSPKPGYSFWNGAIQKPTAPPLLPSTCFNHVLTEAHILSFRKANTKGSLSMLVLRKEYFIGLFIAVVLWIGFSLDLVNMYQGEISLAVMAPISRGSADKACVSLMFNVDWGEEHIPQLLEILEQTGARATFFPTGIWAQENSGLLEEIISKGHEVGNHGGSHAHVEHLPKDRLQAVIKDGENMILKAAGVNPSKLFAPPYGEWSDSTVEFALEIGYQTILWTVDTVDWRRPAPETIWKRALAGARPGALILLHPTEPTVEALPEIIAGLKEKGLSPVTVSELLN